MLTKRYVNEVIVQGDYMSGDRNAIASALRVHQRLGILILAPEGSLKTAQEMQSLYQTAAGANRVAIHPVVLSGRKPEDAVKAAYKQIDRYCHGKGPCPRWIDASVATDVTLQSATYGTRVIADTFRANASAARNQLHQFWRLDQVQNKTGRGFQDLQPAVDAWLKSKGFRANRAYVFLFTKEGDRRAEKAHHFTSILTWRILQERIARETSVIPVATGDDIGLLTTPTMVKFWDKDDWKNLLKDVSIDARSAQLGMWCYLAEWLKGVSIIGMRSGMIEVPALLGIRTLYIEEKHNQQAARMEKWIGAVPTYERQVVNAPPGIKQQVYWKEQSLKLPSSSVAAQHAVSEGDHLNKVVTGFSSKDIGKKQAGTLDGNALVPQGSFTRKLVKGNAEVRAEKESKARAQALASAVFGRGGLAPQISAADFQLKASEFNSIMEWVKKTPKPTGATEAVYGSVTTDQVIAGGQVINCKKRDEVDQKLKSERNIQSWSEYFSSPEYLKKIGVTS